VIRRHRARADRRAVLVSLTAAGRQVVDQASTRRALIEEILGRLPSREQHAGAAARQAFAEAAGEVPDSLWPPEVPDAAQDLVISGKGQR
jgi:DNA-binding MarR family transcriptional regulator